MVLLAWDPDRYDLVSEYRIFLVSRCIWDHTVFAEVILFSFLGDSDLEHFCATCYSIHVDRPEIRSRLNELQEHERLARSR